MSTQKQGETFVMGGGSPGLSAPIEFTTFLLGLASTAVIHLGEAAHPETGQEKPDLLLARESLDLLSMLRVKTRGNLTPDEEKFFDNLLADLRIRFVEASRR